MTDFCSQQYMGKTIHLIGIGGVSMNSLAELLMHSGFKVTGSDRTQTSVTDRLTALGANINYEHLADNVNNVDLVIRNSAIHDDNPEIVRARELNIPIIERAEAWGRIMKDYENVICLSGTHGKTTTTSMMSLITIESQADPTIMVGSNLPAIGGTLRIGGKGCFVAESCEYTNSFLSFYPTVAVILNVEEDHLDFFKDIDDIIHSFHRFCLLTPESGAVVVNHDDKNAMKAAENTNRTTITFGTTNGADVYCENISINNGYYSFDVMHKGTLYTKVTLSVPGKHNMLNALACCASSIFLGIDGKHVSDGLKKFTGSSRRFQLTGKLNGAVIVDDYAHHPSEMTATLKTAKEMDFDRIICVFQPHTYTRTHALFGDFVQALKLCDKAILCDIYAAREQNTIGISSKDISDRIDGAEYYPSFAEIEDRLRSIAKSGDLILTMGAGDVYKIGQSIVE